MGLNIPHPNPDPDETPRPEAWLEVTEAQGGHAQVLTLWKVEDNSEGLHARPVWQAIRPKGAHGPLLLVPSR